MKISFDKKYLKICKYVVLTTTVIYLLFQLINSIPSFFDKITAFAGTIYDVSSPVLMGLIIAYLFFGPMDAIEHFLMKRKYFPKKRMLCRGLGLTASYVGVFGFIVLLLFGIYAMIGGQLSENSTISNIIKDITNYLNSNSVSADSVQKFIIDHNIPFGDIINDKLSVAAVFLQDILLGLFNGFADFVISLGGNIFSFLISIILSIYILFSHEYFNDLWNKILFIIFRRSKAGIILKRSLHTINYTFSKYIRGQLIEAFIVGVMSSIVLLFIGIDYAVIIGIIAGICNLVPYVGPFVGIVLAVLMALFSGNIWMVFGSIVGLIIVQQIDCNILSPKIVGDIVGLHPAFIIIAITVGGNLYGLLGMLIAVPIAASVKTLISDWFDFFLLDKYEMYSTDLGSEKLHRNQIVSAFTGTAKQPKQKPVEPVKNGKSTENIKNTEND